MISLAEINSDLKYSHITGTHWLARPTYSGLYCSRSLRNLFIISQPRIISQQENSEHSNKKTQGSGWRFYPPSNNHHGQFVKLAIREVKKEEFLVVMKSIDVIIQGKDGNKEYLVLPNECLHVLVWRLTLIIILFVRCIFSQTSLGNRRQIILTRMSSW